MVLHLHWLIYLRKMLLVACIFMRKIFVGLLGLDYIIKIQKKWQRSPLHYRMRHARLATLFKNALLITGIINVALISFAIRRQIKLQTHSINGRSRHTFKVQMEHQEPEWNINLKVSEQDSNLPYVDAVFQKLLMDNAGHFAGITSFKWELMIIDDNDFIDTSTSSNGTILVYRSLLKTLNNTDNLAIVLGHEIAHVLQHHWTEKLLVGWTSYWFIFVVAIVTNIPLCSKREDFIMYTLIFWSAIGATYLALEFPFSRMIELEADSVGLALAARACFNLTDATSIWTKLAVAEVYMPLEMLSSHPFPKTRIKNMQDMMGAALIIQRERNCFQNCVIQYPCH